MQGKAPNFLGGRESGLMKGLQETNRQGGELLGQFGRCRNGLGLQGGQIIFAGNAAIVPARGPLAGRDGNEFDRILRLPFKPGEDGRGEADDALARQTGVRIDQSEVVGASVLGGPF